MVPQSTPKRMLSNGRVDCACDYTFMRPVEHAGDVHACLRCGAVTVRDAIWDEPRPHDVQIHGYFLVEVSPQTLEWLGAWPRLAATSQRLDEVFLPAKERAQEVGGLEALERAARDAAGPRSYVDRLRQAGIPASPAPSPLPRHIFEYADIWSAMQLSDDSPLEIVQSQAKRGWGARIADEILLRRPKFLEECVELIRDASYARRDVGLALAERHRLSQPSVVEAIRDRLRDPLLDRQELHVVKIALYAIRADARSLVGDLRAVADRCKDDYYEHKGIVDLVAAIESHA